MADTNEAIKIDEVKTHVSNLEGYFDEFSKLMTGINEYMADRINVGPESAVFGEAGRHLWAIWDENASTFGDFYANFDTWSKMVTIIMANGLEFTEETINTYKSKGSSLNGIQERREKKFLDSSVEGANGNRGKEHVYYDESGNKISVCIDDETGKPYYKTVVNADGTTTIYRYDKDGNMSVVGSDGNVKYYSADGKELLERPETFRESGLPYSEQELASNNAYDEFMENYGNPDGSLEWQEKFAELPSDVQKRVLDVTSNASVDDIKSKVSSDNSYAISHSIPADGQYDGRTVVIPTVGESVSYSECHDNAKIIIASGNAVIENLDGENISLKSLQENLITNDSYNNLTQDLKEKVDSYLNTQIENRSTLSSTINADCSTDFWRDDGAVGNADSAYVGESYEWAYGEAVKAAENWKNKMDNIDTMSEVRAMLNSYGVFY